jgi:hypothetical protein
MLLVFLAILYIGISSKLLKVVERIVHKKRIISDLRKGLKEDAFLKL